MPRVDLINRIYYHWGAPLYEAVLSGFTWGKWWKWQEAVLAQLPSEGPVLELGCGTGRLLVRLAEHRQVVGVDLSAPMLRRARERLSAFGHEPRLAQTDIRYLPFPSESFAAAVATGVLTAMPDADPAVREIARVLRPGGKVALIETQRPREPTLAGRLWIAVLVGVGDHLRDLPALLRGAGLDVTDRVLGRAGTVHLITAEKK